LKRTAYSGDLARGTYSNYLSLCPYPGEGT